MQEVWQGRREGKRGGGVVRGGSGGGGAAADRSGAATQKRATFVRKPPNISSIAQEKRICPSAFCKILDAVSYGISHLAKCKIRLYHKDTKKE